MKALLRPLSICLCASLTAWQNVSNFPTMWLQWASNCCERPPPHPHATNTPMHSVLTQLQWEYPPFMSPPPPPPHTHTHTHQRPNYQAPHLGMFAKEEAGAGGPPCACRLAPQCLASCAPGLPWALTVGAEHTAGEGMLPKERERKEKREGSRGKTEKESKGMRKVTALYIRIQ